MMMDSLTLANNNTHNTKHHQACAFVLGRFPTLGLIGQSHGSGATVSISALRMVIAEFEFFPHFFILCL